MSTIVEVDEKGRVLIPAEIRRKLRTRRFRVSRRGNTVQLEPLASVDELRGKYRQAIKSEWDDLEDKGEEFVTRR